MKKYFFILLFLIVFLLSKFWIGIYTHDEFGNEVVFIKHRPLWKTCFYSPRGMSDMTLDQMTPEQREEQLLFNEFVIQNQKIE